MMMMMASLYMYDLLGLVFTKYINFITESPWKVVY